MSTEKQDKSIAITIEDPNKSLNDSQKNNNFNVNVNLNILINPNGKKEIQLQGKESKLNFENRIKIPNKYNELNEDTQIKRTLQTSGFAIAYSSKLESRIFNFFSSTFYYRFLLMILIVSCLLTFLFIFNILTVFEENVREIFYLICLYVDQTIWLVIAISFILLVLLKKSECSDLLYDIRFWFDIPIICAGIYFLTQLFKLHDKPSEPDLTRTINFTYNIQFVVFHAFILLRALIFFFITKNVFMKENMNKKNVQDIINFTEIEDPEDRKTDREHGNNRKSINNKFGNAYKQTPQASGLEEELKVPKQNNLIIDKLKEKTQNNNSGGQIQLANTSFNN